MALPTVALLLGFMISVAFVQERLRERQLPSRAEELERLVRRREAAIDTLSGEVAQLSRRLAEAREARGARSERLRAILEQLEQLRAPSGMRTLRGPGVVVELADSPGTATTREELTDLRIQDVDLRLVVNELWRAGAEAVAVNGNRVLATTAIRAAGDAILVNFAPIRSPYRVTAIGEPERLERRTEASEVAQQFQVWEEVYGLRFAVRSAGTVTVPGIDARRELRWARPVAEDDA